MVASFGVGNACAVMLGSELGAGKNEVAINYAKKFAILTFMLGGFVGILLYLCIPIINTWFGVTPNLEQSVRNILFGSTRTENCRFGVVMYSIGPCVIHI